LSGSAPDGENSRRLQEDAGTSSCPEELWPYLINPAAGLFKISPSIFLRGRMRHNLENYILTPVYKEQMEPNSHSTLIRTVAVVLLNRSGSAAAWSPPDCLKQLQEIMNHRNFITH
jgi:hypothetical protein